jgi:hypothetical protein
VFGEKLLTVVPYLQMRVNLGQTPKQSVQKVDLRNITVGAVPPTSLSLLARSLAHRHRPPSPLHLLSVVKERDAFF